MEQITVNGRTITAHRITNDINGNPRYCVHFLDFGLSRYESTKLTKSLGLYLYRGRDFGGMYVIQSYNIKADVERISKALDKAGLTG